MELGQRLRQARLEAGLSQRQLCGGEITRNMLSLIENGAARPSMDTLRYLAGRLGKPVSYFLEEQAVISPNQDCMAAARQAYTGGDAAGALQALEQYREPDSVFDQERGLLLALCRMALAERAIQEARLPYAAALLEQAGNPQSLYWVPDLERRRLLLLAQAQPGRLESIAGLLPADDRELLLRGAAALEAGNPARCAQLLDAAEDKAAPGWNLLRGEAYFLEEEYAAAARCYQRAETAYPQRAVSRLEQCYREMEDYKMAYFYACKQRVDK